MTKGYKTAIIKVLFWYGNLNNRGVELSPEMLSYDLEHTGYVTYISSKEEIGLPNIGECVAELQHPRYVKEIV